MVVCKIFMRSDVVGKLVYLDNISHNLSCAEIVLFTSLQTIKLSYNLQIIVPESCFIESRLEVEREQRTIEGMKR